MAYEIVGISGTTASGKDTAAEYLECKSFLHVSTSDVIRAEAIRMYGSIEQHILRRVGHEMRVRDGVGAVCLSAIAQYEAQRRDFIGIVLSGMRSIGPAQTIKDSGGLLISVDAPLRTRYDRLVARGRIGDLTNYEEFVRFEEEQLNGTLTTGQNTRAIEEISDFRIYNDTDLDSFLYKIDFAVGLSL